MLEIGEVIRISTGRDGDAEEMADKSTESYRRYLTRQLVVSWPSTALVRGVMGLKNVPLKLSSMRRREWAATLKSLEV